jgi:hypothetical protein
LVWAFSSLRPFARKRGGRIVHTFLGCFFVLSPLLRCLGHTHTNHFICFSCFVEAEEMRWLLLKSSNTPTTPFLSNHLTTRFPDVKFWLWFKGRDCWVCINKYSCGVMFALFCYEQASTHTFWVAQLQNLALPKHIFVAKLQLACLLFCGCFLHTRKTNAQAISLHCRGVVYD